MSKHENFGKLSANPVASKGSIGALENLAGFAEDINNQSIDRLSDNETLEATVKQRFGSDTSLKDVLEAFQALEELSAIA